MKQVFLLCVGLVGMVRQLFLTPHGSPCTLCLALTAFIADVVLPQLNGASLIEKLGEIQLDPGQQHKRSRRVMTRL
jgi:hypothetical protein